MKPEALSGSESINHLSGSTMVMLHVLVVLVSVPVAMVEHSDKATARRMVHCGSRVQSTGHHSREGKAAAA